MRLGAGRAVAAGGALATRAPRRAPPLRRRRRARARSAGSAAGSSCPSGRAWRSSSCWWRAELAVPMWAERAGADDVAPAPHRRALRPVHDHRAGRVGARGDHGGAGRRSTPSGTLERPASRSPSAAAHRLLHVVAVLLPAQPKGVDGPRRPREFGERPRTSFLWGYGHYVRLRVGGRRRRRDRGGRRRRGGHSALSSQRRPAHRRGAVGGVHRQRLAHPPSCHGPHGHGHRFAGGRRDRAGRRRDRAPAAGSWAWFPRFWSRSGSSCPSEERVEDPHLGSATDGDDPDGRSLLTARSAPNSGHPVHHRAAPRPENEEVGDRS